MNFKNIVKGIMLIILCVVIVFLILTIVYLSKGKSFCEIKMTILAGLQKDGYLSNLLSSPEYIKSVCK